MDSSGEEIDRFSGFRSPEDLIAELKPFLAGESFGAYKKRLAKDPNDLEAALKLAQKYESRRSLDDAGKLYAKVLAAGGATEEQRQIAEARQMIVSLFKSEGDDLDKFVAYFRKHRESEHLRDHARILFEYSMNGQDTDGVVEAGEYLAAHPGPQQAQMLNAYAWYLATQDTRLERAVELAKKAVALAPKDSYILDTLAEAYARSGKHELAVKTAEEALKHAGEQQREELAERLKHFKEGKPK